MKRKSDKSDEQSTNENKSFSRKIWGQVRRMLGIVSINRGDIIPDIQVPDMSDNVTEILQKWDERYALSRRFPGDNEGEIQDYIVDILLSVLPRGKLAYRLKGKDSIHIYASNHLEMPIIVVIEVNMGNFDQGRSHLYPQLKNFYESSIQDKPIYGAISSVEKWVFVRYDGKKWLELEPLAISTEHDQNGILRVVDILYKIIQYQFVCRWKKLKNSQK
jgi:hypothetical protein